MEIFVRDGAEFLLTFLLKSALFTDVTSDTERHFYFRAFGHDFEETPSGTV